MFDMTSNNFDPKKDYLASKDEKEFKPLPTGVGRFIGVTFQVLKYDIFCNGTIGG
jgi:hypothetical protein